MGMKTIYTEGDLSFGKMRLLSNEGILPVTHCGVTDYGQFGQSYCPRFENKKNCFIKENGGQPMAYIINVYPKPYAARSLGLLAAEFKMKENLT